MERMGKRQYGKLGNYFHMWEEEEEEEEEEEKEEGWSRQKLGCG